jgi:hypothetical protein
MKTEKTNESPNGASNEFKATVYFKTEKENYQLRPREQFECIEVLRTSGWISFVGAGDAIHCYREDEVFGYELESI